MLLFIYVIDIDIAFLSTLLVCLNMDRNVWYDISMYGRMISQPEC